jgi:excisionase family DNA binding protein
MNIKKSEIGALEKWLNSRLGALLAHGDKVRDLLNAADASEQIIKSSVEMVTSTSTDSPPMTEQQMATWKKLLPILAEHGLMTVRKAGPSNEENEPLTKGEAAEFLGFSERKLERCMRKRQIAYEKFGTGQNATVRFRRSELEKFRQSRNIPARKSWP